MLNPDSGSVTAFLRVLEEGRLVDEAVLVVLGLLPEEAGLLAELCLLLLPEAIYNLRIKYKRRATRRTLLPFDILSLKLR